MKEELIKYVMERANKQYSDDFPIAAIGDWIDGFFEEYIKPQEPTAINVHEFFVPNLPDEMNILCKIGFWKVADVNNFDASTSGCEGTENLKNDHSTPQ